MIVHRVMVFMWTKCVYCRYVTLLHIIAHLTLLSWATTWCLKVWAYKECSNGQILPSTWQTQLLTTCLKYHSVICNEDHKHVQHALFSHWYMTQHKHCFAGLVKLLHTFSQKFGWRITIHQQ